MPGVEQLLERVEKVLGAASVVEAAVVAGEPAAAQPAVDLAVQGDRVRLTVGVVAGGAEAQFAAERLVVERVFVQQLDKGRVVK